MIQEWNLFKEWLNTHYSEGLEDLNPPAADDELVSLQESIGCTLPAEFIQFLKIHDGQAGDAGWLIDGSELLSTERILSEWTVWNDLLKGGDFDEARSKPNSDKMKSDWWNAKWIPFTYDGSGNHLCIDLDPAPGGKVGQIITMWHDDPERDVIAESFQAWFADYVGAVLRGEYAYSDEYGGIVDVDDLEDLDDL
jgi:cell wall assembly regulator SMI1